MTPERKERILVAAILLLCLSLAILLAKGSFYQQHTNRAEHNAATRVQRQR